MLHGKPKKKKTTWLKNWAKDLNRHHTKKDIQMATKHMRRYPTSYAIKELQIKAMRYHYTLIRMTQIQKHWQHYLAVSNNVQYIYILWYRNPLLEIHPGGMNAYIHQNIGTRRFEAVLFIVVKNWKPLRWLSVADWLKKVEAHPHHRILLSNK